MEGFKFVHEQTVTWRDLDPMGHVNNAVYLTYCETARLWYLMHVLERQSYDLPLAVISATINYHTAAGLADQLLIGVRVQTLGERSFTVEHRIEERQTERLVADNTSTIVHLDEDQTQATLLPGQLVENFTAFEPHLERR